MDDTNPTKEDTEYVDAIQEDIHWLGFDWGDRFFYGSDYFEKIYEFAVELIKKGLAYVCELTPEQFKEYRGDVSTPARSPWRDRPVEESLDLFAADARPASSPTGKYTLRAKIDLASGNFNMRDPVHLPHPPHAPPPPGRQVVHLSHVRLCPPHSGRAGGHHPLPLFPGV